MKKLIFIWGYIAFSLLLKQNLYSQNQIIDSLLLEASKCKHDSTRLNFYIKICEICPWEENIKFGQIAVLLSDKLIRGTTDKSVQTRYIKQRLNAYKFIEVYYSNIKTRNVDSLEAYNKKSLDWALKSGNSELVHKETSDMIETYLRTYKITQAVNYLLNELKRSENKQDKEEIIFFLNQLANVYSRIKNNEKALAYQLKILKLTKELNDTEELPWVYFNLGSKYSNLKDYRTAIFYYLKANKLLQGKLQPRQNLFQTFKIAITYKDLRDFKQSRAYYSKALEIVSSFHEYPGDSVITGVIHSEIGQIYFIEKNYTKALEYKLKGIGFINGHSSGDAFKPYLTTGDIYLAMKKFDLAEKYVLKAINIAEERVDLHNLKDALKTLSDINKAKGNMVKSNEYMLRYYVLNDSLNRVENAEELMFKEMNYENERNEMRMLAEQKIKDNISEEEKNKQKIIIVAVSMGLFLVMILLIFIYRNYRLKQRSNEELSLKNETIAQQKHLVEEKQKEILDSITYAKRLQEAILPPQEFINKYLQHNFILYKPKDLVAGDFYWAEKVNELFFIAAADSTGHGVPGAMVSVVCSNALNRALKEFKETETGKILDKTRELVLETFEKSESDVKDGMDISLLCIDTKNKKVFWSGANNPLWYIQDNELKEIKADKQPIGKSDHGKPFTTHNIDYIENTLFYLFTDGLADQFGGPNGKKFKYKQFADILMQNHRLSLEEQAKVLNKTFADWKGDLEQVDDVCVIGLRL